MSTLIPTVRGVFDLAEQWEMQRQGRYEAEAHRLVSQGREAAARERLQRFVNENCARVEKEYRMLNATLPAMLETVGIKYLYTDYLAAWTSKKGVPLPIR